MIAHPNRGRRTMASTPTTEQILTAREAVGLTQEQAARLIYSTASAWQRWEGGERTMHPAMFELFLLKTKQAWV